MYLASTFEHVIL